MGPATEGQLRTLEMCGVAIPEGATKDWASQTLNRVFASRALDG